MRHGGVHHQWCRLCILGIIRAWSAKDCQCWCSDEGAGIQNWHLALVVVVAISVLDVRSLGLLATLFPIVPCVCVCVSCWWGQPSTGPVFTQRWHGCPGCPSATLLQALTWTMSPLQQPVKPMKRKLGRTAITIRGHAGDCETWSRRRKMFGMETMETSRRGLGHPSA